MRPIRSERARSLFRQTIAIVLLSQLLCAVALASASLWQERRIRLRALDRELAGHSDSLLGAIQDAEDADDNVTIDPSELVLPAQDVFAVYTQAGRLLGASAHAPGALLARRGAGFRSSRVNGERYRVFERDGMRIIDRAENGGVGLRRPVTIIYASPERHLWHEIMEAASFSLITIAVAATVTALLVTLLLRRELRPLPELAAAAADLSLPSLRFRAPASALAVRELRPLAEMLTAVTERMRLAFEKEQRFVGDAAHELRTAAAVVRSSVQLLMLKPRSVEQYSDGLSRVLEDTDRVEELIARMLEQARFDASPSSAVDSVDLAHVAGVVMDRLQPLAQQRGVLLQLNAAQPGMLHLSLEAAEVLISNLLRNAIQYSAASTTVELSVLATPFREVCLRVEDHGCGIDADALPHVFDRFYRGDRARARATGGSGLGLSICKAIVDGAGGTIEVRSEPGVGTCVRVLFTQS